jgi:hypothetical protein
MAIGFLFSQSWESAVFLHSDWLSAKYPDNICQPDAEFQVTMWNSPRECFRTSPASLRRCQCVGISLFPFDLWRWEAANAFGRVLLWGCHDMGFISVSFVQSLPVNTAGCHILHIFKYYPIWSTKLIGFYTGITLHGFRGPGPPLRQPG